MNKELRERFARLSGFFAHDKIYLSGGLFACKCGMSSGVEHNVDLHIKDCLPKLDNPIHILQAITRWPCSKCDGKGNANEQPEICLQTCSINELDYKIGQPDCLDCDSNYCPACDKGKVNMASNFLAWISVQKINITDDRAKIFSDFTRIIMDTESLIKNFFEFMGIDIKDKQ